MIQLDEYRKRKNRVPSELRERKTAVNQIRRDDSRQPSKRLGYIHRKVSPFCDPLSKRPCVTVCAPPANCACPREAERQKLIEALSVCENGVTIGKMKAGCRGGCVEGPLLGFPHKEFFYTRVVLGNHPELTKGIESGQMLFELLALNSQRSYRNDIYYDKKSGFLAAIDEHVCMVQVARYFLSFQDGVTCGKCVQCRVAVRQAGESIDRLISCRGRVEDIERVKTLCGIMEKTTNCDYASSAVKPIQCVLDSFEEEFHTHIEGVCAAGICFDR
ncbi:MAG: NADH-ubiquinone oxidoreductase-F iron-sulfur binding region domain-containing protein [Syntrophobacteraceae bacterium]